MAHSVDLRKRIVAGVLEQGLSIGEVAKLFQVGSATVERYLQTVQRAWQTQPPQVAGSASPP